MIYLDDDIVLSRDGAISFSYRTVENLLSDNHFILKLIKETASIPHDVLLSLSIVLFTDLQKLFL